MLEHLEVPFRSELPSRFLSSHLRIRFLSFSKKLVLKRSSLWRHSQSWMHWGDPGSLPLMGGFAIKQLLLLRDLRYYSLGNPEGISLHSSSVLETQRVNIPLMSCSHCHTQELWKLNWASFAKERPKPGPTPSLGAQFCNFPRARPELLGQLVKNSSGKIPGQSNSDPQFCVCGRLITWELEIIDA